MVFNSLIYLYLFLPLAFISYHLVPGKKIKKIILLCFSLLFYAWGSPVSLVLLLISIIWNYLTGIEMDLCEGKSRKTTFIVGVAFNVFVLMIYKYVNFLFGFTSIRLDLTLPVGLSFFTFSAISYLADVYMKKSKAQKDFVSLALYISFFGKVSMGPIVQYHDMEKELLANKKLDATESGKSFKRFIKGLAKKVLIADQLSLLYAALSTNHTMMGTWICAIAYMLQIYFDFSGYSDMAIGISALFGFHFDENFDHPYTAVSVQDFWRRWHISLSRWFRDYIYIPLGGSRVDNSLYVRNIFVVWLLTGIWHGANWNFIAWGIYYGLLLLLERFVLKDILHKLPKAVQHLYALFLVLIGWILFFSPGLLEALKTILRLFGVGAKGFVNLEVLFELKQYFITLLIAGIFSTRFFTTCEEFIMKRFKQIGIFIMLAFWLILFIVSISFVVASTFQSFLYFAF